MTFSKIKAKETRELTRTLEKTLEVKLACSDTAVIDNKILNNEIDKLERNILILCRLSYLDSLYHLKLNYLSSKNPYLFLPHLIRTSKRQKARGLDLGRNG
jgi:hypothetical protein